MLSFGKHQHPKNPSLTIVGYRLGKGDTIQAGDVYGSTTGKWEQASLSGFTLEANLPNVCWVHPIGQRLQMSTFTQDSRLRKLHAHPMDHTQFVWGERLSEGDTIKKGDYFATASGKWQEFTSHGHTIQKYDTTYWVRMQ